MALPTSIRILLFELTFPSLSTLSFANVRVVCLSLCLLFPPLALTSVLFIPLHLLVCLFHDNFHRGHVEGEHEHGVFGGGGKVLAGERAEHSPGRLLETQRLFTSLEGKCGRDAARRESPGGIRETDGGGRAVSVSLSC